MARKKKHEEGHVNHERWLITYSDLITLLMIFFIIMYSSSNVDKKKYAQMAQSLSAALGEGSSSNGANVISSDTPLNINDMPQEVKDEMAKAAAEAKAEAAEKNKLTEVKGKIDSLLQGTGLQTSVGTVIEERGLVVSLKDTVLFDSGSAEVKAERAATITEIGKILNTIDNYVRIEGHTDDVPIKGGLFKTNWELSVVRATTVTRMLIDNGGVNEARLSALGYGQNRPIADNSTEEGKGKNRRVDIVVMDSKFNQVENNKK